MLNELTLSFNVIFKFLFPGFEGTGTFATDFLLAAAFGLIAFFFTVKNISVRSFTK